MRKSKADTAETRKRIVSVASKVFLDRGLAATGIADIMSAAGLTQGGFYRHFESKEQLIAEANSSALASLAAMLAEAIAGKTPAQAIATIVDIYLHQLKDEQHEHLCPIANIGSELRNADAQVRAIASNGYIGFVDLIGKQAQLMGIADHADLATSVVSTIVGAVMLSRLAPDAPAADVILANAQATAQRLVAAADSAVAA